MAENTEGEVLENLKKDLKEKTEGEVLGNLRKVNESLSRVVNMLQSSNTGASNTTKSVRQHRWLARLFPRRVTSLQSKDCLATRLYAQTPE